MICLTVNLCAATSAAKLEALRLLLEEKDVAVALLQEVALPRLDVPGYAELTTTGEGRRGTAILVREDLSMTPLLALPSGRGCAVKVGNLSYVCVYAPAGSRQRKQRAAFFSEDVAQLLAAAGPHCVLGGDFNCVLRDCDTTGTTMKSPELARLVGALGLIDVWPRASPQPGHTFATGAMSARLDRFYASPCVTVHDAEVVGVAFSDHCAVRVGLGDGAGARARRAGRRAAWRFDTRILKDPAFLPGFRTEWERCVAARPVQADVVQWWLQHAKPFIRRHAARFTREWRKDCRNKLSFLYQLLQELVTTLPRPSGHAELIKQTKQEILDTHAVMLVGYKERTGLDDVTMDEPLSAVHVGRAAKRARQQNICSVQDADGQVLTDPADVQEHFRALYEAKFQAPDNGGAARGDSAILAAVDCVMNEEDNRTLCRPFSSEEVHAAVTKCPKRKSPGQDGVSAEFYVAAWGVVGETLTEVLNAMWEQRDVPPDMTQGVITLVPKKARPVVAKDWRPITLLDVDAKILARLMTARLAAFQDRLLHPNQVRPGGRRTMAGALCDLRDVLSALGALRTPGCVLSIDFSGAFDCVRHDFLFEVLRRRGVASHFVDVLRSVYAGATSRLRVNGELTASFQILASVRQGCPASMLLFSIVLAPLLTFLEPRLQGLALARSNLKLSAYADDAFLVLRDHEEATRVMDVLQQYAASSGLRTNPEKCGALAAGGWRTDVRIAFPYVTKLKVLGVTFQAVIKNTTRDNWASVLASVRGVLADNAMRALGLSQRARYVTMYALSKMWHVAQVLPVPKGVARDVVRAVGKFLWRGQLFTTSMAVAATPRAQGGLGIPDVANKCLALFTGRWQGVLVDTPDSFAGEWLHALLGSFPLGARQRAVWPAAWHFTAFHTTRTTASSTPPDVPARDAIRAIYDLLVAADPAPQPRVQAKAPGVDWPRVWASMNQAPIPEDVWDAWFIAVHDLVATRARLHRIGRSDTRTCPVCRGPDTLRHRLTACPGTRAIWLWTRRILSKVLGCTATARTLLQPDFSHPDPERMAVAAWVAAHTVAYVTGRARPDAAGFAACILQAKEKACLQSRLPEVFRLNLKKFIC